MQKAKDIALGLGVLFAISIFIQVVTEIVWKLGELVIKKLIQVIQN